MYTKFKKGIKVIVNGIGETDGKIYRNMPAIIIETDSYFKDFYVQFKDGSNDWILPQYIRKPYTRKENNKK